MIWLSAEDLFPSRHVPIVACRALTTDPTDTIAEEAIKIIFVVSGASRLRSVDGHLEIGLGDVVTIREGAWWSASPVGFVTTVTLYVRGSFLRDQVEWFPRTHPMRRPLEGALHDRRVIQLLDIGPAAMHLLSGKLFALAALGSSPAGLLEIYGKTTEILDDMQRLGERTDLGASPPRRWSSRTRAEIVTAVRLLRDNLNHRWNVSELARAVSLSESQLTRLFRRELGISPAAFLWQARTDAMAELLAAQDLTVAEAAERTGWASPAPASRAFRRRYGVSPVQFSRDVSTIRPGEGRQHHSSGPGPNR